jgi:hypothetical protein
MDEPANKRLNRRDAKEGNAASIRFPLSPSVPAAPSA